MKSKKIVLVFLVLWMATSASWALPSFFSLPLNSMEATLDSSYGNKQGTPENNQFYLQIAEEVKAAFYENDLNQALRNLMQKHYPNEKNILRNYENARIVLKNSKVKIVVSGYTIKVKPKGQKAVELMFYR